jgi:nicotinamide mononucleotide adenylyltransferase
MKKFKEYISEAKNRNDSVVFSFGRNQPPTAGHGHIVQHVMDTAAQSGAHHVVYTSGSGPTHKVKAVREKNPLHPHEKVETMKAFFPGANIQHHEKVASPFHAIEHLKDQGYKHVKMVVGADRVEDFRERMAPYAKHFKSFEVVSPGAERMSVKGREVSGTAARRHAAAGDYKSFRAIMPEGAPEHAVKTLFKRLRTPVKAPAKKTKKKLVEMILNYIAEARPRTAKEKTREYYSKEYREHQSSPKAIKERGERWTARRRAAVRAAKRKLGSKAANKTRDQLIKIGQGLLKGKDVDHKKPLSKGGSNGNGNVRVVSRSYNRSRNNNIKEADEGATKYLEPRLLKKDKASRPNPEPITQKKSLPGIPPLPKV